MIRPASTRTPHPGPLGLSILKLGTWFHAPFLRLPPSLVHRGLRISTAGSRYPGYAQHRIVEALDRLATFVPATLYGLRSFFDGILIEPRAMDRLMDGTPFRVVRVHDAGITRHDVGPEQVAAHLVMAYTIRRELGFRGPAGHPRGREIRVIGAMAFRDFALRVPGGESLVAEANARIAALAGVRPAGPASSNRPVP